MEPLYEDTGGLDIEHSDKIGDSTESDRSDQWEFHPDRIGSESIGSEIQNLLGESDHYINDFDLSAILGLGIGAPVRHFIRTDQNRTIRQIIQNRRDQCVRMIGSGQNLVITEPLDCIVIQNQVRRIQPVVTMCSQTGAREVDSYIVTAGVLLDDLVESLVTYGSDLSSLSGIPGTIGGAVWGNAGAYGMQIGDFVMACYTIDTNGQCNTFNTDQLEFSYRNSMFRSNPNQFILSVTIRPPPNDPIKIRDNINRIKSIRNSKLPPRGVPNAGSVFRNICAPGIKIPIFQLFADLEIRSDRIASYEKHRNILVNRGGATGQDFLDVIDQIVTYAFDNYGIRPELELSVWGDSVT